jgi:SH3-like domain-containing protein
MMLRALAFALLLLLTPALGEAQSRKPPYWASIAASKAMMRTGPGKEYPATWQYQRSDLPIRVIEIYKNWRKIQDPDGTTGWMQVNLLSDQRTAIVTGTENQPMYEKPEAGSAVRYIAQPNVVGRLSECGAVWCHFAVKNREGYIAVGSLYGLDPGESF